MKFRRIASFFREIGGSSTGFSKDWRRGELVECAAGSGFAYRIVSNQRKGKEYGVDHDSRPCTAPKGLIIDPPYDVSGKVEYDKEYNGCNSEVGYT